jgi:hypothetical protein
VEKLQSVPIGNTEINTDRMSFEKGNQLWKLRSKHGRDALFTDAEKLWESACDYFQWCNDNPILSTKSSISLQGSSNEVKEFERPFTRQGLFLFLDCSETWLTNFKKECSDDFLRVINAIEKTIDNQQIEHAMVGIFNSNLVARIQGIKDQSDITTNGKEINTAPFKVEIVKPIDESDNSL